MENSLQEAADAPHPLVTILLLAILVIGVAFWFSPYRIPRADRSGPGLPGWKISALDFGLWVWAVLMSIFLAQFLAYDALPRLIPGFSWTDEDGGITVGATLVAALTLQLPMLLFFIGFRAWKPGVFRFPLDSVVLGPGQVLRKSLYLFFLIMPLVWAVNIVWFFCLEGLERLGLPVDRAPQTIVETVSGLDGWLPLLGFTLLAVVLAPVVEELVFRGCVYRFLKGRLRRNLAFLLSAFCFALLHGNLASFLPLLFLGIALAVTYEVTGNIRVPIVIHGCFNAHQLALIVLQSFSSPVA